MDVSANRAPGHAGVGVKAIRWGWEAGKVTIMPRATGGVMDRRIGAACDATGVTLGIDEDIIDDCNL